MENNNITELDFRFSAELEKVFDDPNYYNLIINSISFEEEDMIILFSTVIMDDETEIQHWKLTVENYKGGNYNFDNAGMYFKFYSEHFLISQFTSPMTEIYIKSKAQNAEKLFVDIYRMHRRDFNNMFDLEKYLCCGYEWDLYRLCQLSNGIFARGPKSILTAYFDVLKEHNTEPYFLGEYPKKIYKARELVVDDTQYKLMTLGDKIFYIVGENFKFEKKAD